MLGANQAPIQYKILKRMRRTDPDPKRLLKERMAALEAERARVQAARQRAVDLASQAAEDPKLQNQLFKAKLPEYSSYCSTRSCEIERAAGYTLPNEFTINDKTYKAGDKVPVIPGTKQFGVNAEKMGYRKLPKEQMQPGDRLFLGNTPFEENRLSVPSDNPQDFYHSMIFGGYDENNKPIYYYDQGPGKPETFIKRVGHYKPSEIGAVYRYEGSAPMLEQEIAKLRAQMIAQKADLSTVNTASTEMLKSSISPQQMRRNMAARMTGTAPEAEQEARINPRKGKRVQVR